MSHVHEKLKVLLVTADPAPWGLAACYTRAFIKSGYEAKLHLLFGGRRDNRFPDVFINRIPVLNAAKLKYAQKSLLTEAERFKPDLIMITKGTELSSDMLGELKEVSRALLCNLYTDSPLVYPGYPALLKHSFSSTIQQYDCVFTFARFLVPVFYVCGARRVEYLPFAHDPEIHRPVEITPSEIPYYQGPVAYLGTWSPSHERWLEMLAPFEVKIWGEHWDHLPKSSSLRACWQKPGSSKAGMGPNMAKVCAASAILFNFVRAEHGCAHSMKTFEIPACRGFMLCNRTDEQLEYFEEDKCAVYFSTAEELVDKVRFYLAHDDVRENIAENGYKEVCKHTYSRRLSTILNVYRQLSKS